MRQLIVIVLFGTLVIDAICLVISTSVSRYYYGRSDACKDTPDDCPESRPTIWKCYENTTHFMKFPNVCAVEIYNEHLRYCQAGSIGYTTAEWDTVVECVSNVVPNVYHAIIDKTDKQLWCFAANFCRKDKNQVCAGWRTKTIKDGILMNITYYHSFHSQCDMAWHNCQQTENYQKFEKTENVFKRYEYDDLCPKLDYTTTATTGSTTTTISPTTTTTEKELSYWCNISKTCTKGGAKICSSERDELFLRKFPDFCSMAEYNCLKGTNYTEIEMAECVQVEDRNAGDLEHRVACKNSFNCPHNRKQKCGINRMGLLKRFYDICDMIKFNCKYRQDYIRTHLEMCSTLKQLPPKYDRHLPTYHPIHKRAADLFASKQETTTTGRDLVVNKYWCWRAKYCSVDNRKVCARDRRLDEFKIFSSECTMYKYNCEKKNDFTATSMLECKHRHH